MLARKFSLKSLNLGSVYDCNPVYIYIYIYMYVCMLMISQCMYDSL